MVLCTLCKCEAVYWCGCFCVLDIHRSKFIDCKHVFMPKRFQYFIKDNFDLVRSNLLPGIAYSATKWSIPLCSACCPFLALCVWMSNKTCWHICQRMALSLLPTHYTSATWCPLQKALASASFSVLRRTVTWWPTRIYTRNAICMCTISFLTSSLSVAMWKVDPEFTSLQQCYMVYVWYNKTIWSQTLMSHFTA